MIGIRTIIIVGLGLIGGSLAAACRRAFPRTRIVGVSRNPSSLRKAKSKGWIHEGTTDLKKALHSSSLVVLSTPVDTLKNFLVRLDRLAPRGTVVTDAGSVKGFLVRWSDLRQWKRIQFVGAHPMAGSHLQGIPAARPELFKGALTFVARGRKTSPAALRLVAHFWKKISGRVLVISPELHDRLTAEISHVPHLLAALLVANVSPRALRVAASGFLDSTRVAQGDPQLWAPILLENHREVEKGLEKFEANLKRLKKILAKENARVLRGFLQRSRKRRIALENRS